MEVSDEDVTGAPKARIYQPSSFESENSTQMASWESVFKVEGAESTTIVSPRATDNLLSKHHIISVFLLFLCLSD